MAKISAQFVCRDCGAVYLPEGQLARMRESLADARPGDPHDHMPRTFP